VSAETEENTVLKGATMGEQQMEMAAQAPAPLNLGGRAQGQLQLSAYAHLSVAMG
jgi:hypothetical protein